MSLLFPAEAGQSSTIEKLAHNGLAGRDRTGEFLFPFGVAASGLCASMKAMTRREFEALGLGPIFFFWRSPPGKRIVVSVNVMLDRGAHSGKGLQPNEVDLFRSYQDRAAKEYAVSGIGFDLRYTEGAYLRTQGYSEIPDKFLVRGTINLFVTDALGYDIDRDRTGGCSMGPRPRRPGVPPDPFYKSFVGLKDARGTTLPHEYAHHLTLDTRRNPTVTGNVWADLRNDYWLWRQRHGAAIEEFRRCVGSEWARMEG